MQSSFSSFTTSATEGQKDPQDAETEVHCLLLKNNSSGQLPKPGILTDLQIWYSNRFAICTQDSELMRIS